MDQALDKMLIGKASTQAAASMKTRLASHGIEVALVHNAATCGKGCGGNEVEIWAHPTDAPDIAKLLDGAWRAELASMGYDPQLADQIFDPSAEHAVCPACATQFSTAATECPECGLCFAPPEPAGRSGCR